MSLKESLITEMEKIETYKKEHGIEPVLVNWVDIEKSVKLAINELCKEKRVKAGRQVNNVYFKVNNYE